MNFEDIDTALDIEPTEIVKSEPVPVLKPQETEQLQKDYEYSRGQLYSIIEKGGAWYTVLGERLQGRAKVIEYLKENPEKLKELESTINA